METIINPDAAPETVQTPALNMGEAPSRTTAAPEVAPTESINPRAVPQE
jgi:hypothetical protein